MKTITRNEYEIIKNDYYKPFKLFATINDIDYIVINYGWDVITENEHFVIDPETGEKTSIE